MHEEMEDALKRLGFPTRSKNGDMMPNKNTARKIAHCYKIKFTTNCPARQ